LTDILSIGNILYGIVSYFSDERNTENICIFNAVFKTAIM
jgi:hypothetical protein